MKKRLFIFLYQLFFPKIRSKIMDIIPLVFLDKFTIQSLLRRKTHLGVKILTIEPSIRNRNLSKYILRLENFIKKYKKHGGDDKLIYYAESVSKGIKNNLSFKVVMQNIVRDKDLKNNITKSIRCFDNKVPDVSLLKKSIIRAIETSPSSCSRQGIKLVIEISKNPTESNSYLNSEILNAAPCRIFIWGNKLSYSENHALFLDAGILCNSISNELNSIGISSCSIYGCESSSPNQKILKERHKMSANFVHIISIICGYLSDSDLNNLYTKIPSTISIDFIT